MMVEDLPVPEAVKKIVRETGIKDLYPPQTEGLDPALKGKNLVLSVPTATGKSLVAYLAIVQAALKGEKSLYIVPLRALASEKYEDLKRFEKTGIRVKMASGDLDSRDPSPDDYDILIATSEKADSMLRHRPSIARRIRHIVADEVHLIHDKSRGPTLEFFLTKMRKLHPNVRIIALSATIKNSSTLADWLDAVHVSSTWRPVQLREGVYLNGIIHFPGGEQRKIEILRGTGDIESMVIDTLREEGQALVFVNTRRSAEAVAERIGKAIKKAGSLNILKNGQEGEDVSTVDEEESSVGERLKRCLENGAAFHHAGLSSSQRAEVERRFRNRSIGCIVATPTLAAGMNLPARRVIIRDLHRYESSIGRYPMPLMEVKQMSGRAGRPGLDPYGEAILMAKEQRDMDFLMEHYILGETEDIDSKLVIEPVMKTHILSAIAGNIVETEEETVSLFKDTFFGYLKGEEEIGVRVKNVLHMLEEEVMIEKEGERFRPTLYGKIVSDLYIDPESAVTLRKALFAMKNMEEYGKEVSDAAILHAVCATTDMRPLYIRKRDDAWVEEELEETETLLDLPYGRVEYEYFLRYFKTALLLRDWIEEKAEKEMEKRYHVGPGDIRMQVDTARWILHAMSRLSEIFYPGGKERIETMGKRVEKGIREELLPLISIRGIGRVRARALYDAGFTSRDRIRIAEISDLAAVHNIGEKIASKILDSIG